MVWRGFPPGGLGLLEQVDDVGVAAVTGAVDGAETVSVSVGWVGALAEELADLVGLAVPSGAEEFGAEMGYDGHHQDRPTPPPVPIPT